LAIGASLLFLPAPTQGQDLGPAPKATATPISPFAEIIGLDLVDQFRITTDEIWHVGNGSINGVMHTESDAMVLTRVSLGETPGNLDDRIYIMWNIRLRAYLGFKNAGAHGGWRAEPNRWGPPTSIKIEALCNGGCQYEAVRATHGIYFPLDINSHIRTMISPTDERLADFYVTYMAALEIVNAPITDYPERLRGYESFRAPSVTWIGTRNRSGGLLSTQYFRGGEIWRDEFPQDNVFWEEIENDTVCPETDFVLQLVSRGFRNPLSYINLKRRK